MSFHMSNESSNVRNYNLTRALQNIIDGSNKYIGLGVLNKLH